MFLMFWTLRPASGRKAVIDLRVLDGKSAQNISILLGGTLKHLTHEQVKKCLLRCDTQILTQNVLQQLIQVKYFKLQEIHSII